MEALPNPELKLAYDFLQFTNQHVFLTGKAGTGKTTFLKQLKQSSPKRMVVVAPTGVAAINAGGVTIHSFFQMAFGPQLPVNANSNEAAFVLSQQSGDEQSSKSRGQQSRINRFSKEKINIIRSLDLLVIDEISMVRADVLDGIDAVLRRYKNRDKPFGGVQLLMIGDLQQLAPVVKEDEWNLLRSYYDTFYFFSSRALKQSRFIGIELKHIYRQSDQHFIDLLNKVRDNKVDAEAFQLLNSRYIKDFKATDEEGYIVLTTHNYQAHQINDRKLAELKTRTYHFEAQVEDDFPEYAYPTDRKLQLKVGAQVMFVKNDTSAEKRYYNGKIGRVVTIDTDSGEVKVLCQGDTEPIPVEKEIWENTKYHLNETTQEIEETVVGKFIQQPLKLAWAITIHKSQGLTFEKAIINARQSFAHGQVYVALSRCKSLEGLVLSEPLQSDSVINDTTVIRFTSKVEEQQPGQKELDMARQAYEKHLLKELFDFSAFHRMGNYLLKTMKEHESVILGNMPTVMHAMLPAVAAELIDIARKFIPQLEVLFREQRHIEKENPLEVRVKQAAAYFSEKFKTIVDGPWKSAAYETDNKALKKQLNNTIGKMEEELAVKRACLDYCSKGFEIKEFLAVRARAALVEPGEKQATSRIIEQSRHPDFYRQLIYWRNRQAEINDTVASKVLRQSILTEIANLLPDNVKALKSIKGMGGTKMRQFGKELLELILQYREEQGMSIPEKAAEELDYAGLSSPDISLKMHQKHYSLLNIAQKRGLALSTIEGHMVHHIEKGDADVYDLLDREKIERINDALEKNRLLNASQLREQLANEVSYNEIRMVLAHRNAMSR
ncbi:helix-turn-helix domain-containing protein [Roseimarinus sediminis]|uniref:helix-turn-helix domain-containing protein n=1 Tax=Roseimarinus sediminis TaxID=1610899 RepID=UPI003D1E0582